MTENQDREFINKGQDGKRNKDIADFIDQIEQVFIFCNGKDIIDIGKSDEEQSYGDINGRDFCRALDSPFDKLRVYTIRKHEIRLSFLNAILSGNGVLTLHDLFLFVNPLLQTLK